MKNSSARPDRWDSANNHHSAAVQCNSPSFPHREPPMVGRSRPPSEQRLNLNRPVHHENKQTKLKLLNKLNQVKHTWYVTLNPLAALILSA